MLQGKSIIPPATRAIKMLIETFLFDTSCAHFPPQHVPIFPYHFFFATATGSPNLRRRWMIELQNPDGGPPGTRISFCGRESNLSNEKQKIINRHILKILIDHGNDVIKCSKLKWNHEPQASGFTAKF